MKQTTGTSALTKSAVIAALYVALGIIFAPIAFGPVQLRVAEAFTLLPVFTPAAIWGVTLGCGISNAYGFFMGMNMLGALDIIIGSFATLIAAYMTYALRRIKWRGLPILAPIPPILVNAVIIGAELSFVLTGGFNLPVFLLNAAQVALGQFAACYVLGLIMVYSLQKTGLDKKIF